MKNLLILVSFFFTATLLPAQMLYQPTDWKKTGLKGEVKQLKEFRLVTACYTEEEVQAYRRKGQKVPEKKREINKEYVFNAKGYLTDTKDYWSDCRHTIYKYNDAGARVSETLYVADKLSTVYTYSYDAAGLPSDARKVKADGTLVFTEQNKVSVSPDSIVQVNTHVTERGETAVGVIVFHPDRRMKSMSVSKDGMPVQCFVFDEEGKPVITRLYRNGQLIQDLRMVKTEGRESVYSSMPGEKTSLFLVRELDGHGNPLKETKYNPDGSVKEYARYTYSYDSLGNWVQRTEFDSRYSETRITEREIQYYP